MIVNCHHPRQTGFLAERLPCPYPNCPDGASLPDYYVVMRSKPRKEIRFNRVPGVNGTFSWKMA